jgi:hypothetical protein
VSDQNEEIRKGYKKAEVPRGRLISETKVGGIKTNKAQTLGSSHDSIQRTILNRVY